MNYYFYHILSNIQNHKNVYNVLNHGLVGDGVTDNTDELVQLLNNFADDSPNIYFPEGIYHFELTADSTQIFRMVSKNNISFIGENPKLSIIQIDTMKVFMFRFVSCEDITVKNLTFTSTDDSAGMTNPGTSGVRIHGGRRYIVNNCIFDKTILRTTANGADRMHFSSFIDLRFRDEGFQSLSINSSISSCMLSINILGRH